MVTGTCNMNNTFHFLNHVNDDATWRTQTFPNSIQKTPGYWYSGARLTPKHTFLWKCLWDRTGVGKENSTEWNIPSSGRGLGESQIVEAALSPNINAFQGFMWKGAPFCKNSCSHASHPTKQDCYCHWRGPSLAAPHTLCHRELHFAQIPGG